MQKIFSITIRLAKQDSSILYFTLESNENLAFYSTLKSSLNQGFRDILITGSTCFKQETYRLLNFIKTKIELQIINES